jgi:mono/diheme cytochrome c family protein
MKRFQWVFWVFLVLPLSSRAQQGNADKPLNDIQKLGQRVFQQRCAICHAPASPGFVMYGPALYKDLVIGSEDSIKEIIRSGSGKMPGFKLGLQASEMDAIVEYLKTVPKPAKSSEPGRGGGMGPVD